MSFELIQDLVSVERLARTLASERSIALDCEAAGFHRYTDRLSLVQLSTPVDNYVLDPFAIDLAPLLGPILEDPDREVILHGADYDLRLLDRDLGLTVRGLYDTQVAGAFSGEPALGLSALLGKWFDVKLSKKYQKADWAARPLSPEMLDYAASDTRHLHRLAARLRSQIAELGREHWVEEENRFLEELPPREDPVDVDPLLRVKAARGLSPRVLARLRAGIAWRDALASRIDRAPFRVASDQALINVAEGQPTSTQDLAQTSAFPRRFARDEGQLLLDALRAADGLPEEELTGFPRPPRGKGPGRLTPEEDERAAAVREVRNARAPEVGVDRGLLLPNHLIMAIARANPRTREALEAVPSLRGWQVELFGEDVLRALG
jgi:ribonuclease D